MIKIFSPYDRTFTTNGDIVIHPLKARVHKEDNGDYYLELETGLQYMNHIVEDNIVVANTPNGDQAFRISNVTKTKSRISAKCWHVFYDSENYLISDSFVVDKNCGQALYHLNTHTDIASPFTTYSDIETIDSYRCVRKTLYEAIQEVMERWGGHIVRDNFEVGLLESIGQDNGVTVQYAKNLQDITCEENWDNVVTKILPVGRDGILLNELNPSADIYVTSDVQYGVPYTKTITFEQDIDEENYSTETAYKQALIDDLMAQAQAYLEENCIPQVNYTLKANLEKITDIGDVVEVIDERLGIHLMTNVISVTYDCLLEKYVEIEFGNFTKKLSDLVGNITASVTTNTTEQIQTAVDEVWLTLEKSYVIFDGEKILVVDALPKESAHNVIKIDSNGIQFGTNGISGAFLTLRDFVYETGTSGDWSYKKWSSGYVSLDCVATIEPTMTSLGDFYSGQALITYPFAIGNAKITANVNDASGVAWIANAKAYSSTQTQLTLVKDSSSGSQTVSIHVEGILGG